MSLPKQVQAQIEEAERLERELQEAANPVQETPQAEEPKTEEAPEAIEVPAPTESEAPQSEPTPEPEHAEDSTWERKYKTLQGMYNADVPRLRTEVSDLKSQLETAIAKLESASATKEATPAERLVTDKDVEDFGSDLVDLIKRQATEVAQAQIGRLEDENAQLREQLTGVSERQGDIARQNYFTDLARLVPDYEEVNTDQRFLDWLSEVDTLSGYQRQEYLNQAFGNYDVARTATLFNAFKELTGSTQQPQAKQPPKELTRQVAPGTSKSSGQTVSNTNEKIWSMGEIDRFYKDVARGVFKGNDAEQARIEAEIDLAVQQGRLTQ
jgi:plasmid stabilization system protein ParE